MDRYVSSLMAGKWSSFMNFEGNGEKQNSGFHPLPATAVVELLLNMPQKSLYMLYIHHVLI